MNAATKRRAEAVASAELDWLYEQAVLARGLAAGRSRVKAGGLVQPGDPRADHTERSVVARAASRLGWDPVERIYVKGFWLGVGAELSGVPQKSVV